MQFRFPVLFTAAAIIGLQAPVLSQSCQTVTVMPSRAPSGSSGNAFSESPSLSANGRYMSFSSFASDLVPGDNNGFRDVFRYDRLTGELEVVSMRTTTLGALFGNGCSLVSSISDNGRYIAFESEATNLVPAPASDSNNACDVYVRDMQTGLIERASLSSLEQQSNGISRAPSISGDGRYIAFEADGDLLDVTSDNNGHFDIYLRDRIDGTTRLISRDVLGLLGNASSHEPCISGNGRWLSFRSWASDLVLNDSNGTSDVFLYDDQDGSIERVSVGQDNGFGFPTQANNLSRNGSVSDDGRYVAFGSQADNLAANDNNNDEDIFLRDTVNQTTRVISVEPGPFLLYGNGRSTDPFISGNGRYIAFSSSSDNLVSVDTNGKRDIFRRDLLLNTTELVSLANNGDQSGLACLNAVTTSDGSWTAWQSSWDGFGGLDDNGQDDVFMRGIDCSFPQTYCTAKINSLGCSPHMEWSGEAKADLSGSFVLRCSQVLNQKPGLPFFSFSGRATIPFQGGILCVQPPTKRGPIGTSGGRLGLPDCSGFFTIDMDAYAQGALGGSPPALLTQAGTLVNVQWWGRDPGFKAPKNTQLSDALEYTARP